MSQVNAWKAGLYSKLSGDSTLGALLSGTAAVYDGKAPAGTSAPYVVFQRLAGTPSFTFGTTAYENQTVLVKGIVDGSKKTAGSIAERVDTLLNHGTLTLASGTLMLMRRLQDIEYDEVVDGHVWRHVGATYQIGLL